MLSTPIYSDAFMLVINKPAGMPVLPDGWSRNAPFLVRVLEAQYGKLWVVHRLDKITSGVMVFARTADVHRSLSIQFERHEIRKIYHAICTGEPRWDEHVARHPIRVDVGHSHRSMVDNLLGKPAETSFRVLQRLGSCSLLEAAPRTGRTHQIRVHALAMGFPLLGDTLYSAPRTDLMTRPALHAWSLILTHPISGEMVTCTAPYPEDFSGALKTLQTGLRARPPHFTM